MMNSTYIFLMFTFIVTGITLAIIPFLTRKTENFGVSIPETLYNRRDFKKMRMTYTFIMISILFILTIFFLIMNTILSHPSLNTLYIIIILSHLLMGFLVYLPFHFKMKKVKQLENWTEERKQTVIIDTSYREEKLVYSNWWYVFSFFIITITIAYSFAIYDSIPDKVVTHIGMSGKLTYSDKSPGTILLLPLTQLFLLGTFLIINYVIKQSKQQVSATNPDISKQQSILYKRRWSLFMIVTGTMTIALLSFLQMSFIYEHLIPYIDPIMYTVIGIILVGTIILSINTGQGGSRIKIDENYDDTVINRDDDEHWKLGQFYFNKDDPAVFIEKRFGVGWSANFARPLTWIFIGGLIVLPLLLSVITLFF